MGTTRDVLTGVLELENVRCAIFDCAGIKEDCDGLLEMLAKQSAIESLGSAGLVLLCVDAVRFNVEEEKQLVELIKPNKVVFVLTKCDLIGEDEIITKLEKLASISLRPEILGQAENDTRTDATGRMGRQVQNDNSTCCVAVSSKTGLGIDKLKKQIEKQIVTMQSSSTEANEKTAINQRHRQIIETAIASLTEAKENVLGKSNEIAVMLLREVYRSLGSVETEHVDEKVLDRIFSQFCIGK